MENKLITITALINASIEKVWNEYVQPEHIMNWNYATDDWHCPSASCDLKIGGSFSFRMASKNEEHEFDLNGTYSEINPKELISYELEDGRGVKVLFKATNEGVSVEQTFEPESINPMEMQRDGWQAILNNFKKYVEKN